MSQVGVFYRMALEESQPKRMERINEIKSAAKRVEQYAINKMPGRGIVVACAVERLDTAITSYFFDVHRYKHFHGMLDNEKSLVNFAKVYAFTSKWLAKERPFYLKTDPVDANVDDWYMRFANYINEIVILLWIQSSFKNHVGEKLKISPEEETKLLYSLKYREVSTSFFELYLLTKFPPEFFTKNTKNLIV